MDGLNTVLSGYPSGTRVPAAALPVQIARKIARCRSQFEKKTINHKQLIFCLFNCSL